MNPPAAAVRRSPHFRSGWCRGHGRKDATPPFSRCGRPPGHRNWYDDQSPRPISSKVGWAT